MKLAKMLKKVAGIRSTGRNLKIFPDDVILVGYPKSGNTWLNFLVACLVSTKVSDVDFTSIERFVADIYCNSSKELMQLTRPRYLKSHEPYDPRYGKVIYIVRDPRDVVFSYYYHKVRLKNFDEQYSKELFTKEFLLGKIDGLGSWYEHVRGWLENRMGNLDFLLIHYEQMKMNPSDSINRIASFIGREMEADLLRQVLEWTSFENMKSLDLSRTINRDVRKEMPFVRSGKTGEWINGGYRACAYMIENEWGDLMKELGYA